MQSDENSEINNTNLKKVVEFDGKKNKHSEY